MTFITKTSDQTQQRGTIYLYSSYSSPGHLVLPPPASLLISRFSGAAATEQTLSCLRFFFLFSPKPSLSHLPNCVYNSCAISCASSALFYSPRSRPSSRPHSHPSPRSVSATAALVSVPAPVSVPIPCTPAGLHLRSCPAPSPLPSRSRLAFLRSPPPTFSFLLRPLIYHRSRPYFRPRPRSPLRFRPRRSRPRPRSLLLVPRTQFSPW